MGFTPPAGFTFLQVGASHILVDEGRRERLLMEGLSRPTTLLETARRRHGGRGGAYDLVIGGEELVVRQFRRGGLVRWFLRNRTFARDRSIREVEALVAARERSVPAVTPVAAVATPAGLGLYRHLLLTLSARGAVELLELLGDHETNYRERSAAIAAAASTVRAAFESGIELADLHPRNLLIVFDPAPRCLLVDLDRAVVRAGALPPAVRIAALARFVRFLERHKNDGGAAMSRAESLRFIRGVEGKDWRRIAREVHAHLARTRWLHAIGALWRPGSAPRAASLAALRALPRRGGEAPVAPAVSLVLTARREGDARRALDRILGITETAGLRSFEIVALARSAPALAELRALSPAFPSLRFCGVVERGDGPGWRALVKSARGERIALVEPGALDPGFLTEALERLAAGADVVAGLRGGPRDARSARCRLVDATKNRLARALRRAPVRDPFATFLARNDDRFQAAVRAMRGGRFARAELLSLLSEAGARFEEVAVSAAAS